MMSEKNSGNWQCNNFEVANKVEKCHSSVSFSSIAQKSNWIVPVYEDAFHHKYPMKIIYLSTLKVNMRIVILHCLYNVLAIQFCVLVEQRSSMSEILEMVQWNGTQNNKKKNKIIASKNNCLAMSYATWKSFAIVRCTSIKESFHHNLNNKWHDHKSILFFCFLFSCNCFSISLFLFQQLCCFLKDDKQNTRRIFSSVEQCLRVQKDQRSSSKNSKSKCLEMIRSMSLLVHSLHCAHQVCFLFK